MTDTYPVEIAGLKRELPLVEVAPRDMRRSAAGSYCFSSATSRRGVAATARAATPASSPAAR